MLDKETYRKILEIEDSKLKYLLNTHISLLEMKFGNLFLIRFPELDIEQDEMYVNLKITLHILPDVAIVYGTGGFRGDLLEGTSIKTIYRMKPIPVLEGDDLSKPVPGNIERKLSLLLSRNNLDSEINGYRVNSTSFIDYRLLKTRLFYS